MSQWEPKPVGSAFAPARWATFAFRNQFKECFGLDTEQLEVRLVCEVLRIKGLPQTYEMIDCCIGAPKCRPRCERSRRLLAPFLQQGLVTQLPAGGYDFSPFDTLCNVLDELYESGNSISTDTFTQAVASVLGNEWEPGKKEQRKPGPRPNAACRVATNMSQLPEKANGIATDTSQDATNMSIIATDMSIDATNMSQLATNMSQLRSENAQNLLENTRDSRTRRTQRVQRVNRANENSRENALAPANGESAQEGSEAQKPAGGCAFPEEAFADLGLQRLLLHWATLPSKDPTQGEFAERLRLARIAPEEIDSRRRLAATSTA